MKTEKNQSKSKTGGMGVSTVVTAFVTGAATGFAVGAFLHSKKSNGLKDKLKNLISDFKGSGNSATTRDESNEEIRPAGYVQDTDNESTGNERNYRQDTNTHTDNQAEYRQDK